MRAVVIAWGLVVLAVAAACSGGSSSFGLEGDAPVDVRDTNAAADLVAPDTAPDTAGDVVPDVPEAPDVPLVPDVSPADVPPDDVPPADIPNDLDAGPRCADDGDCDDANPCTTDFCDADGVCRRRAVAGLPCDDRDACTVGDTCDADGVCAGGTPVSLPDDPCSDCACDPSRGVVCAPRAAGDACDDGDCCTTGDRCGACPADDPECSTSGLVCAGNAGVCDDADPCTADVCACAGDTRQCAYSPAPDGTACELDPNACTEPDTCQGGVCTAGAALPLDDGNPCTRDRCDKGDVLHDPLDGGQCDDRDDCTTNDRCATGACVGGAPVECALPVCAGSVSCVTGQGCVPVWAPNGVACDDGDGCTAGGTCDGAGVCVGGAPLECPLPACASSVSCLAGQGCVPVWAPAGAGCDDGDACTEGDACDGAGACVPGTPRSCPLPACATSVACVDGQGCVPTWAPNGSGCDDGDPCTVGDACDGAGGCQPGPDGLDGDRDGAVSDACGGPDCNDGTAAISPGVREDCENGIDDDCDGLTDGDDDPCGSTVDACTVQFDCGNGRMCALWPVEGQARCSEPCARSEDCPPGQVCHPVPGSALVGFCATGGAGGVSPVGSACTTDGDCRSGRCDADGRRCVDVCAGEGPGGAHCPGSAVCSGVGDLAAGFHADCLSPALLGGGFDSGLECSADGYVYDSSLCASGHCDLTAPVPQAQVCTPLCSGKRDCPYSDQVCDIVLYSTARVPESIPFTAQSNRTRDVLLGCYYSLNVGTRPVGMACDGPGDCYSGKCLPVDPGDPTQWYCTDYCAQDSHCSVGMTCGFAELTLVSGWLQDPNLLGQPVLPYESTLARICIFED